MTRNWILVLVLVFLALQFFIINGAQAEYRVYRLGVKYNDKQKTETEVVTTLDDLQYATYYRQTPTQTTRLIEHWMCWGHTDEFKHYCGKPSQTLAAARQPTGTAAQPPPLQSTSPAKGPNQQPRPPTSTQNPVPVVIQ